MRDYTVQNYEQSGFMLLEHIFLSSLNQLMSLYICRNRDYPNTTLKNFKKVMIYEKVLCTIEVEQTLYA